MRSPCRNCLKISVRIEGTYTYRDCENGCLPLITFKQQLIDYDRNNRGWGNAIDSSDDGYLIIIDS